MKHGIKQERGGEGMMGWIKPVCSCGWEGTQHFAYNDTQYTDARQQADNHVREAYRAPTHHPAPQTSGKEGNAPVFDQAEFDTMVAAGTKAWAGVPDSFVEELRSNSPTTPTTPANAAAANGDGQPNAIELFTAWKGYPLPELNNHGQFHQDWLHREFIAFKAGLARSVAAADADGQS